MKSSNECYQHLRMKIEMNEKKNEAKILSIDLPGFVCSRRDSLINIIIIIIIMMTIIIIINMAL